MTILIKSQVEIIPGSIAIGSSGKGKKIDRIDGDILHCGSLKIRSSAVVNVIPVLKVGSRYLLNGDRSITLKSISEDGIGYTQLSIYGFMLFGAIESIAPITAPPINPRLALSHANGRIEVDLDKLDLNYLPSVQTPSWSPTTSVQPYGQLTKLYLDIETTGLHPEVDRVLMVGLMSENGVKTIITDPDEKVLLSQVMEFLRVNKPELLIGHNLFNFDLPFLTARCRINGVPNPFTKAYKTSRITSASVNGQPIEFTPIYWKGTQILDTFQQVAIWDKAAAKLDSYGLKPSVIALGLRDDRRLELDVNQIKQCWDSGDLQTIEDYLVFDLTDTQLLADFLLPVVYYQMNYVPNIQVSAALAISIARS